MTSREFSKLSIKNKSRVLTSSVVGCYYCLEKFSPNEIEEWADCGETAICPHCFVDSVLDEANLEYLTEANAKCFGGVIE